MSFDTLCLIGTGLIGGSFALRAREVGLVRQIIGVDSRPGACAEAQTLGIVDECADNAMTAVANADLVVVAVPPAKVLGVLAAVAPHVRPDALVMDTGSTKAAIVEGVGQLGAPTMRFVGAHPIAGTEKSGPRAAFASLFVGAKCILTPGASGDAADVERARRCWEALGMRVVVMDAATHDMVLAGVSHLPHMVAYALVNVIAELSESNPGIIGLSGAGFKDTTRIASSHPEMWRDICFENKAALLATLSVFERHLADLKRWIESDDAELVYREFERSRRNRARILEVPYDE